MFGLDGEWNIAIKRSGVSNGWGKRGGCFAFAPMVVYEGCGISGISKPVDGSSFVSESGHGDVRVRKFFEMLAEANIRFVLIGSAAEAVRGSPVMSSAIEISVPEQEFPVLSNGECEDIFTNLGNDRLSNIALQSQGGRICDYATVFGDLSVLWLSEPEFSVLLSESDTVRLWEQNVSIPSMKNLISIRESISRDPCFPMVVLYVLEYMLGVRDMEQEILYEILFSDMGGVANNERCYHPLLFFDCDYHRFISKHLKIEIAERIPRLEMLPNGRRRI